MQFDAFFELCRMYSAWAEASRAELVGDVIHILGPLEGTWIQQVGDLGKVRWKFRTGIYRPEGDQLQMGLTPVWLDHNPPDGDLSKLDYNRVPVLPAFANHEGMELTEAQRAALANPARYQQVLGRMEPWEILTRKWEAAAA
eukprot:jgi/Tetstr1/462160/TSEL_007225.t1